MCIQRLLVALALLLVSTSVFSTEYRKDALLTVVEAHAMPRPTSPETENREFLTLDPSSSWIVHGGSGGGACRETVAVLPTNNAALRAIALTAIASGAIVTVIVDSSLPMILDICQITVLSIKRGA